MGNMIGTVDDDFNALRYAPLKKINNKGINHTALGRYSTPNLANSNPALNKKSPLRHITTKNVKGTNEFNSKIYKDIFPPPNSLKNRNTMSPLINNSLDINRPLQKMHSDTDLNKYFTTTLSVEGKKENEININDEDFSKRIEETGHEFNGKQIFGTFNFKRDTRETIKSGASSSDSEIKIEEDVSTAVTMQSFSPGQINSNTVSSYSLNEYELKCVKSAEDIRRSYIAKLIYKEIWTPTKKEKNHNTLIIFDWDDTLLCTSFLTPNGVFSEETRIPEKDLEKIKKLESSVFNILSAAIKKGETYIITNAAPGWVEYSANRFYPEVAKILHKLTIVSARGDYEKKHPGDSRQWKILAFLEMLKNLDSNLVTNLICLGDSVIEMEAAHILASKFSQAYIKTIKFREAPKPEELNKQLGLVIDQFDKIFSGVKNLTIRVEKKSKDTTTNFSQIK